MTSSSGIRVGTRVLVKPMTTPSPDDSKGAAACSESIRLDVRVQRVPVVREFTVYACG